MTKKELLNEIEIILDGIDRADGNSDGWWETSTGAKFGKERLDLIRELFDNEDKIL